MRAGNYQENRPFQKWYTNIFRYRNDDELYALSIKFQRHIEFVLNSYPLIHLKFGTIERHDSIELPLFDADNDEIGKYNNFLDLMDEEILQYHFGYDYLPIDKNDIENCALNYIWDKYSEKIKRCRKCLCKFDESHYLSILGVKNMSTPITVKNIQKFAEHFKIPHYAVDCMGNLFHSYKPDKYNKNLPVIKCLGALW